MKESLSTVGFPAATEPMLLQEPGVEFLKQLKRAAPQIGRIKIPGGAIIALAALAPQVDAVLEANIRRHLKKRTKHDEDSKQVVKVSDAVDCVHRTLSDPKILLQILKDLVSIAIDPGGVQPGSFAEPVEDCIREHALRQDTPRVKQTVTYWGRPARGHGHRSNRKR